MDNTSTRMVRARRRDTATKIASGTKVVNVGSVDFTMLICIIILVLFGIVMIFSASYETAASSAATGNDPTYYLKRQLFYAGTGFCVMIFFSTFNFNYFKRWALPIYIISNALLVIVQFIGVEVNGKKRAIMVPIFGTISPAEFAKIGIILYIAYVISKNKDILKRWPGFLYVCGLVGITVLLDFTNSMSAALIVAAIGFGMILVASPYVLRFVIGGAAGITAILGYLVVSVATGNFRGERFTAWLDPFASTQDQSYQVVNSLYAIGTGGLFGVGLGQGREKSFVPMAFNDCIFSVIVEELGLIGGAFVLIIFGVLIWRGIRTALKAPNLFGTLVACGIVIMIATQVIINVSVVTNTIPNTGVTLPFISYGGTALIVTMFLMGILLNISRYTVEK